MMVIPIIKLNNGVEIPAIGNGPAAPGYSPKHKFYSDNVLLGLSQKVLNKLYYRPKTYRNYVNAVAHSFKIGITLLDYSSAYGNGHLIAKAIKKSGLRRKDLFLTTRISNGAQKEGKVRECLMEQLKGLGVDYVDLLMFHWPVTGCYLDTWQEMVKFYKEGYCRAIGVANCHQHHLEKILKISDIVPVINQVEIHPLFTQKTLIAYCKGHAIQVEAYTPIARMDDRLVRLPLLRNIAKKYGKTIVQVVLRWHIQNGVIPIVRSLNKNRQLENISIFDFELTSEEMIAIDSININSRLRYDPDNCDFSIL
jgi:diketogulonate reductase-like aldo/keto reductase